MLISMRWWRCGMTVLASATTVRSSSRLSDVRLAFSRDDAEQPQHAVRDQVRGPDDGVQDPEQDLVDERRRQRERSGYRAPKVFGATSPKMISTTVNSADADRRECLAAESTARSR